MTQPGKFDPSFVDPAAQVSQQSTPANTPVKKQNEKGQQKFKNVLERKIEQAGNGEEDTQNMAAGATTQPATLFDLASNSQSSVADDAGALLISSNLLTADPEGQQTTAGGGQQLIEAMSQFPFIPDPGTLYSSVKNSGNLVGMTNISPNASPAALPNVLPNTVSNTDQTVAVPQVGTPMIAPDTTTADKSKDAETSGRFFARSKDETVISTTGRTPAPTTAPAVYTPPAIGNVEISAQTPAVPVAQTDRAALVELVNQMASSLVVIAQSGQTDTQITIQYPPIFQGATVVITEFSTSQNQFNITFYNLSPDARALIANVQNQDNLRSALIDRGYTLQMVTIESKGEPPLITTGDSKGLGQGRSSQQGQSMDSDAGNDTVT